MKGERNPDMCYHNERWVDWWIRTNRNMFTVSMIILIGLALLIYYGGQAVKTEPESTQSATFQLLGVLTAFIGFPALLIATGAFWEIITYWNKRKTA